MGENERWAEENRSHLTEFNETSIEITPGFMPRLDYLKAVLPYSSILMKRLKGRK